jgi:hypothetical protein
MGKNYLEGCGFTHVHECSAPRGIVEQRFQKVLKKEKGDWGVYQFQAGFFGIYHWLLIQKIPDKKCPWCEVKLP